MSEKIQNDIWEFFVRTLGMDCASFFVVVAVVLCVFVWLVRQAHVLISAQSNKPQCASASEAVASGEKSTAMSARDNSGQMLDLKGSNIGKLVIGERSSQDEEAKAEPRKKWEPNNHHLALMLSVVANPAARETRFRREVNLEYVLKRNNWHQKFAENLLFELSLNSLASSNIDYGPVHVYLTDRGYSYLFENEFLEPNGELTNKARELLPEEPTSEQEA